MIFKSFIIIHNLVFFSDEQSLSGINENLFMIAMQHRQKILVEKLMSLLMKFLQILALIMPTLLTPVLLKPHNEN